MLRTFIVALVFMSSAASAADSGPAAPKDPLLERYSAASASNDWSGAAATMKEALSRDPNNPDYHNLYAYSLRKLPNPDLDIVFKHYNEALRINPKHRGAHEYIGEAYLMVGNLGKAKEHLGVLGKLCFLPCQEFNDLKKAIAQQEQKR
jgi:tetratricopeptide (TPR) repeat protein